MVSGSEIVMTAPTFYGVVNKMTVLDDIGFADTKVSFVSSGQYEWVDKRNPNMMTGVWPHSKLTAYPYPPRDQHQDEPFNELDPGRWFKRGEDGWEVKELEDVCQECASPWCMWYKNNTLCKDIIQSVVDESNLYDTTIGVLHTTVLSSPGMALLVGMRGFVLDGLMIRL